MTRAEKTKRIAAILDRLYPQPDIPLGHRDPFTLLVAVVLSAQTTDAQVNRVTPALFRRAPTPAALARMPEHEILKLIRSCGLAPSKARNIKRLAQTLVDGVDSKQATASVVMTQAFAQPAFPVDTHIHRLAIRWGLSKGRNVKQTESDLKKLFPREEWGRRHLQIIYFGREYCPARNHDFSQCPICSWAVSKRRQWVPKH